MSSKKVDKKLLLNHVRHAGSHNKLQEEKEMWQQREREKERKQDDWSIRASVMADSSLMSHCLVSDTREARRYSDTPSLSPSPPSRDYYSHEIHHRSKHKKKTPSNYWTRELVKTEEADPFRWGHSGYKEQHPEEFVSSGSSETEEALEKPKKKKKRKKKEKSKEVKKSKHEHGKRRKRKRPKQAAEDRYSNSNSSSLLEDSDEIRRRQKRKKLKKGKKTD